MTDGSLSHIKLKNPIDVKKMQNEAKKIETNPGPAKVFLTDIGLSPIGDFFGGVTRFHIAIQVQILLFAIIFKAAFF